MNSSVLWKKNGYQSMRHLSVHLFLLITNVDLVTCHWDGQTTPGQRHPLIFSLQRDITDMSHESHRLGTYYCPVIKKSLSLTCLYLVTKIVMCNVIYCLLLIVHMTTITFQCHWCVFHSGFSRYCLHLFGLFFHFKNILTKMYF